MEGKMLMLPNLRLVEPNNIYRKVPTRKPNAEMRTREYLTPAEVEKLIAAAKLGRHGQRDATLILVAFRHALYGVKPDAIQGRVALNGAQTTLRSCVIAARHIGRAIRQGLRNAARQALLDHQTTNKQQTTSKAGPLPNSVLKVVSPYPCLSIEPLPGVNSRTSR